MLCSVCPGGCGGITGTWVCFATLKRRSRFFDLCGELVHGRFCDFYPAKRGNVRHDLQQ